MAVDLSARTCSTCTHASVCPNRELFMKFYENRSDLMIRCGDDSDGATGSVDTSTNVTVRIEHRYMDGPGLEKTYRELGLHGNDWSPCLSATYTGCPFFCGAGNPYDGAIYRPYPNAAGYIEPICRSARDRFGNRLPFHAPQVVAGDSSSENPSHFYTFLNNHNWTTCKECANRSSCTSDSDIAKLGGTVYSTFGITNVDTRTGRSIATADIPTPKNVLANYKRMDNTPESFTVNSEEDLFIIYYVYAPAEPEPDPRVYMTVEEMEKAGLFHNGELFFNDRSFFYPSLEPTVNPDRLMDVYLSGVICGPINRQSADGHVVCHTGDYIQLEKVNDEYALLYSNEDFGLATADDELIGSYSGKMLAITDQSFDDGGKLIPISIDLGNYRKFRIAEGDRLCIKYNLDPAYQLDLDMMRLMNYGFELSMASNRVMVSSKTGKRFREEILYVDCPAADFVVQTCLVNVEMAQADEIYKHIEMLRSWDSKQIGFNYKQVLVNNEGIRLEAMQPIAPRKWPAGMVTDLMPDYDTDCPPSSKYFVRPYFNLLGYTTDAYLRHMFKPEIEVLDPLVATYPQEIRFLATGLAATNTYWAMYGLDEVALKIRADNMVQELDVSAIPIDAPLSCNFIVEQFVARDGVPEGYRMEHTIPWKYMQLRYGYSPTLRQTITDALKNATGMPDGFDVKLYRIPVDTTLVSTYNGFSAETMEWSPTVIATTGSGNIIISDEENFDNDYVPKADVVQYAMILFPKNPAGIKGTYQAYVPYYLRVYVDKAEVQAHFIFGYESMSLYPDASNAKAYKLSGVYPQDLNDVRLNISSNVIELAGDKAFFYKLSNKCDRDYRQSITMLTTYDNARIDEEQQTEIAAGGTAELEFAIPEGTSIKSVRVNGRTLYNVEAGSGDATVVDQIIESEYKAGIKLYSGYFTVSLWDVKTDITLGITMHAGDNGTVECCSRCKNYIKLDDYDWLEWYPVCSNHS